MKVGYNGKKKYIAKRYIVLFDGDDEVSVWIDKKKGFIKRKSYSTKSNALTAYRNINSVKDIKRWVGKDWNRLLEMAMWKR